MIASARTQIRKRLAKAHMKTVVHQQRVIQDTLNAVLWQIIRHQARQHADSLEEEFDEAADFVLTLPRSSLESMPQNFALFVEHNKESDTISIRTTFVKPKSNIVLPGA